MLLGYFFHKSLVICLYHLDILPIKVLVVLLSSCIYISSLEDDIVSLEKAFDGPIFEHDFIERVTNFLNYFIVVNFLQALEIFSHKLLLIV